MDRTRDKILHAGEMLAQVRYSTAAVWPDARLERMFGTALDEDRAFFIEGQPFFFIATADDNGHCDCSFRGSEPDAEGRQQPAVVVPNAGTLIFPDYRGNNLYSSLGNILVNPHIGLLFIDFPSAQRLRVNGSATIIDDPEPYREIWTTALRYVQVSVEQVFGNCSKRIPRNL